MDHLAHEHADARTDQEPATPDADEPRKRSNSRPRRSRSRRWHDHSAHDPAAFKRKFWLSLLLTIPTLVFSPGLQDILGLGGPRFPGSQYIPAVFGLAIFFYGGMVFLQGGIQELRAKQPGMMTLISLAIVVAFGYSAAVDPRLHGMDFWWELATLITIMLLGHWIEMRAIGRRRMRWRARQAAARRGRAARTATTR